MSEDYDTPELPDEWYKSMLALWGATNGEETAVARRVIERDRAGAQAYIVESLKRSLAERRARMSGGGRKAAKARGEGDER
jgi:hypothetical protein